MIKVDDLEGLKKVQASMPLDRFLNIRNPQGNLTMLMFAANEGYLDIVEWLISLKADINELSRVSSFLVILFFSKEKQPFCVLYISIDLRL